MDERSNYENFKRLLNSSDKVLVSFDIDSATITFLNDAYSRVWKRTRESAIADPTTVFESVHPDDKAYLVNEYRDLLEGIQKYDVEFRILRPDNSVRWLLLSPHLVTEAQGCRTITGIVNDITVVKENIRNLEKNAAKKNSILEILSHDLAGPLGNIQMLADLLSASTQDYENADINKIISMIRNSSAKSIRLIREFVQHEFIESSKVDLFLRRVDLVEKMVEVVDQYKYGESQIRKEFKFSSSSSKIFAPLDQNKFMQVINNLISNAIKFTHDNGTISIDLSERESSVLISVKDNGIGIPKRYHDQLFDKFTKARREGLKGEPSIGLGMSIIKTIVEWHNGSIWFESEENAGTTFYKELPKE